MSGNAVAIIGAGMIGAAHAFGYRANLGRFSNRIPGIRLKTVCDSNEALAAALSQTWGFEETAGDWKTVLADPEIGIVSVCLPNFLHVDVTRTALAAGKHVICEKPLALTAKDALIVYQDSAESNSVSATVFNYRRIPAVAAIQKLIQAGEIGDPVNALVQYQSEYAADPNLPHSWRYERERAGPGALLDIGTHAVDIARFLCGEVNEIAGAIASISIKERFLPAGTSIGHSRVELSDKRLPVDNDDVMSALLHFDSGCQGLFLASRVAVGMGNTLSFSVTGTKGTVRYNSQMPAHYELARFDGSGQSPFAIIANSPSLPFADLLPVPHDGVAIGYAEVFSFMIHDFLEAVANGEPMTNGSILDGLRAAEILDAIQAAADRNQPVKIERASMHAVSRVA